MDGQISSEAMQSLLATALPAAMGVAAGTSALGQAVGGLLGRIFGSGSGAVGEVADAIEETRDQILSKGAVRYDKAQNLTNAEKARARSNIGAGTGGGGGEGGGEGGDSEDPNLEGFLRFDVEQSSLISEQQAAMVRAALRIPEPAPRTVYIRQLRVERHDHFTWVSKKVRTSHTLLSQTQTFQMTRRPVASG